VYLNGARLATVTQGTALTPRYTASGLICGSSYTLGVDAYDTAGNVSQRSSLGIRTSSCAGTLPGIGAVTGLWYVPSSAWNTPIAANPAVAANDASLIAAWADPTPCQPAGSSCFGNPGGHAWTPAIWIANNSTPMIAVRIDYPSCGYSTVQVPIPAGSVPDSSAEGHMAVMQADTGVEYDFYKAQSPNQAPKSSYSGTCTVL
jgi:hypothetical protein